MRLAARVRGVGLLGPGLEALRAGNAAARGLPLLRLLARREAGTAVLPGVGGALAVTTSGPDS